MPYQRTSELPKTVRDTLPADKLKQFMAVVNAQLEAGKSEAVSFASAWDAVKKASSVRVGQRVSWSSSGGTARGIVRRIITNGDVPGIDGDVKVTGTKDAPAAQIEIIDDEGEPTGTIVGHKLETLRKAKYQGRDVDLSKPFRLPKGSSKKFGVYVQDGDKVKRVTFGDPNMEIRRDDEQARANFRARHSCSTAKDKTSARYWSCRMWEQGTSVSDLTKADAEVELIIEKRLMAYPGLPDSVLDAVPSSKGRDIMMEVLNAQLKAGKSESVAFATAWGALENAGYAKTDGGKWIRKRALSEDVFTTPEDAAARAMELGLDVTYHIHQQPDGQIVYMPGPSHEAYAEMMENRTPMSAEPGDNEEYEREGMIERAIRAILSTIMGEETSQMRSDIVKFDEDQRIVWGWASVISKDGKPVYDTQGDSISPDVLTKAANDFMMDVRVAKAMHDGDQVGEVLHSLPLTKELGSALGISSPQEGWIIAMKVHDDEVWKRVKSGELKAFSIGGKGLRSAIQN